MNLLERWILPLSLVALAGCGRDDTSGYQPDGLSPIPVVATYSILGDWVQRVGGDRVQVRTLVGVGGDAHTYEPTPQDNVAISRSAIIFENGLQYEGWLDNLCDSSRTRARRVVVARDVTPRSQPCACHGTEQDPHVWHSIKHAMSMVRVIADELAGLDPDHAAAYRLRAQEYIDQLQTLDQEIRRLLQAVPESHRKLVLTHDSLGYFADEYGFEVLSLLDSFSSEAADPSAMRLASIIRRIQELQIPALFTENTLNPRVTEQVARQAGVAVVAPLYCDALGPADSPAADYIGMMRYNAQTCGVVAVTALLPRCPASSSRAG